MDKDAFTLCNKQGLIASIAKKCSYCISLIALIIMMFPVMSFTLKEPIPQKILGCNIGINSMEEVINILKKQGVTFKQDDFLGIKIPWIICNNVNYEDYVWDEVSFYFYHEKLVSVTLSLNLKNSKIPSLVCSDISGHFYRKFYENLISTTYNYENVFSDGNNIMYIPSKDRYDRFPAMNYFTIKIINVKMGKLSGELPLQ